MARNNKRKNQNPMSQQQASARVARISVRGQLMRNTMLSGNQMVVPVTTTANGDTGSIHLLTGSGPDNDPVGSVIRIYQQFKYLPGTAFTHIPSVGVTSTGNVSIAYITNPESIQNFRALLAGTPNLTEFNLRTRNVGNCKTAPIWQQLTLNMDPVYRRPRYDVNRNLSFSPPFSTDADFQNAVNEADRAIQGAFVVSIVGAPASTTVSRSFIHKKVQVFELAANADT